MNTNKVTSIASRQSAPLGHGTTVLVFDPSHDEIQCAVRVNIDVNGRITAHLRKDSLLLDRARQGCALHFESPALESGEALCGKCSMHEIGLDANHEVAIELVLESVEKATQEVTLGVVPRT